MNIYVSKNFELKGDGTKEKPFSTIMEASQVAKAGDEIIVGAGVYREYIDPVNSGASDYTRIVYKAEVEKTAIITGAEIAKDWELIEKDVWKFKINNSIFGDYNPYLTFIGGDWYFGKPEYHTGDVYLNGHSMYEVTTLDDVLKPKVYNKSCEQEFSMYKWYTEQNGDRTVIYANFQGKNPNEEMVEYNVRRNCFHPSKKGVNYITLSGFTVKQAATQWAPPTAFQDGMIGPHWSKGWIIENCEIMDSKCSGISLGKHLQLNNENKWTKIKYKHGTQNERDNICQAQYEGWTKETIGSHIVRNCHIYNCGQTGIVGHLGGVFSKIENNHIHHINFKRELAGAEIAGIKMHGAIDVVYKKNVIHDCTRGIWLDWQAQGTRITSNLFYNNCPTGGSKLDHSFEVGEDIFVEVSHGPTLIDNNILLSPCSFRLSTQGLAFIHNIIAGSFTAVSTCVDMSTSNGMTPRYTPYHIKHRTEVAGFMSILHGDARFYNNIFIQQEVRKDILEVMENTKKFENIEFLAPLNMKVGTMPYNDYPSEKEYFAQFDNDANMGGKLDNFFSKLPVTFGGNVYYNGAEHTDNEENFKEDTTNKIEISLEEVDGGRVLKTNLYKFLPQFDKIVVDTKLLGEAFEPEQLFENPDGTEIVFNTDYFGQKRGSNPVAGPFECIKNERFIL